MIFTILFTLLGIIVWMLGWATWLYIAVILSWNEPQFIGIKDSKERVTAILESLSNTYIWLGMVSWVGILLGAILLIVIGIVMLFHIIGCYINKVFKHGFNNKH